MQHVAQSFAFQKLCGFCPLNHRKREAAESEKRRLRATPASSRFTDADRLVAVRISRDYRAVGVRRSPDEILWFWIGAHSEYEGLLAKR